MVKPLNKHARYRLKDVEGYRKRKREYASTPAQREKRKLYQRVWRKNNLERHNQLARESHRRNRHKHINKRRNYHLMSNFGITSEQYSQMLLRQKGVCSICSNPPKKFKLAVDHCHVSGRIRGLLCAPCNTMLGRLEKIGFNKFYGYLVNSEH